MFISDTQDVRLTDDLSEQSFEGVSLDRRDRQLVFKDFGQLGDGVRTTALAVIFNTITSLKSDVN